MGSLLTIVTSVGPGGIQRRQRSSFIVAACGSVRARSRDRGPVGKSDAEGEVEHRAQGFSTRSQTTSKRRALPAVHQQACHPSSIDVGWNVATFACDLQARGDALRSFGNTLLDVAPEDLAHSSRAPVQARRADISWIPRRDPSVGSSRRIVEHARSGGASRWRGRRRVPHTGSLQGKSGAPELVSVDCTQSQSAALNRRPTRPLQPTATAAAASQVRYATWRLPRLSGQTVDTSSACRLTERTRSLFRARWRGTLPPAMTRVSGPGLKMPCG